MFPEVVLAEEVLRKIVTAGNLDEVPAAVASWCDICKQHFLEQSAGKDPDPALLTRIIETLQWARAMVEIGRARCLEECAEATRVAAYLNLQD